MSQRQSLQTQFIIFVLFGDLIVPRSGQVWTTSLLTMLNCLGISEHAARLALSRMVHKGWLKAQRDGRHSLYTLTPKGRRLLDEGGQRIFEPRRVVWDRRWQLVIYSLPESKRKLRDDLRKRLVWLGFGSLGPSVWVSPNDRRVEVEAMLDDLNVHEHIQFFSGMELTCGDEHAIIEHCWDLPGLNRQYGQFIAHWEPEVKKCKQATDAGDGPTAEECFVQRFWIMHEYSAFPRTDPNLPTALLPAEWLGDKASQVFNEYRGLVNDKANRFIEATLRSPNSQA